jgi:hypothetical protein
MTCRPVTLPNGGRMIVCGRGGRALKPKRCRCGAEAEFLCDAPTPTQQKTCDRPLCAKCANEIGPDRHLCWGHFQEKLIVDANRRVTP